MAFLHFLVSTFFFIGVAFVIISAIMAIKPSLMKDEKNQPKLNKKGKATKPLTRRDAVIATIVSALIVFLGLGNAMAATGKGVEQQREARAAAQQLQEKQEAEEAERERLRQIEVAKPKVETETELSVIDYETIEQEDGTIPRGESRVSVKGVNGQRAITYEVTYVNDRETDRKEVSDEITKEPIARVVLVGTYVAPPIVETPPSVPSGGSGYVNSQGNFVPSPSDNPAGASAKCRDGTYSYSQSRRGTCSHHGGVAQWL